MILARYDEGQNSYCRIEKRVYLPWIVGYVYPAPPTVKKVNWVLPDTLSKQTKQQQTYKNTTNKNEILCLSQSVPYEYPYRTCSADTDKPNIGCDTCELYSIERSCVVVISKFVNLVGRPINDLE